MPQQTINIGTAANDGTGDPLRTAFDKANDNFTELYAAVAAGTTITSQSGTSYTFVLGDAGTQVSFTNAGAVTATIPPNSSVAFPIGTTIDVYQSGAGQVAVAAGSGVTLRVAASHEAKTREQYAIAAVRKLATDEWVIYGNLGEAP